MRDHARIDRIIAQLRIAWHQSPDLRLGQLMHNLLYAPQGSEIFHIEDDLAEQRIKAWSNHHLQPELASSTPTPVSAGNPSAEQLTAGVDGYTERVGRDMTALLALLASDDELRKAMSLAADPATAPAPAAAAGDQATGHAAHMYDALASNTGFQPDVFALFTTTNKLRFVAPAKALDEQALASLAAADKARAGSTFAHRIQVIDNVPYQMSALPIHGDKDQVVGGLLIGVKLQRLFNEFAAQRDD